MAEDETGKKIDEDWKRKVQEEKQKLDDQQVPAASFAMLVSSLVSQALVGLGEIPNPLNDKREKALDEAKFAIDLLQVLQDKSKGNLSEEEKRYLDSVLYDLRMRFIAAR